MTAMLITHVYSVRGVASGWVSTDKGVIHRLGHMPWQGWFCTCPRGRSCRQIVKFKALVPVAAVEFGARNVEAGRVPAPACVPTNVVRPSAGTKQGGQE